MTSLSMLPDPASAPHEPPLAGQDEDERTEDYPKETDSDVSWWRTITKHLNFYRIHLTFFTFTPLIWSGIFYASNGEFRISYVDSLFLCVSSMTVTGLATVNLSSLTPWQQVVLFIQMCLGSPVLVSWFMVLIRKYYFAKKLAHVIAADAAKRAAEEVIEAKREHKPLPSRFRAFFRGKDLKVEAESPRGSRKSFKEGNVAQKLRPDMIRRVDDAPKLVNPSGWVTDGRPESVHNHHPSETYNGQAAPAIPTVILGPDDQQQHYQSPVERTISIEIPGHTSHRQRRTSDPGRPSRPSTPTSTPMYRSETLAGDPTPPTSPKRFPRTATVEFAPPPRRPVRAGEPGIPEHAENRDHDSHLLSPELRSIRSRRTSVLAPAMSINTNTNQTFHTHHTLRTVHSMRSLKNRGYGGFPTPLTLIDRFVTKFFPSLQGKLKRSMTIPVTMSFVPDPSGDPDSKQVPYLSFAAVVGRNSTFHLLTSDQLDEIGGVEYRALGVLLWIVGGYHLLIQLLAFTIIAPYMSLNKWKQTFQPPQQIRPVDSTWFSAFQVVSAYTNTGTSLVDQSMIPFQEAYLMIIVLSFLILAGNTCFPIFLRFTIWIMTKFVDRKGRLNETLHFLLDHPRRCFIYLFPSHQTWFLLTVVLGLTLIDFSFFIGLDLNSPAFSSIPKGTLVFDGILQACAVRAAGFGIVTLSDLAPAVKVLFVVMMYISVYPVAMSVRSTNVYEEQTLGIFHPDVGDEEQRFEAQGPRMSVWSRYLGMHARKQLAFDMWWLALALFLICWIEDKKLQDVNNASWFNIFNILFDLVSAYGTVGLSLGLPDQNFSFSGDLKSLSKLILCLVMLRGRHRGLPIAIDRAILLPSEFNKTETRRDNLSMHSIGESTAHKVPFRYSETMLSHHGSEIHQRLRRTSKRVSGEDLYRVAEHDPQSSSSDVDSNSAQKP